MMKDEIKEWHQPRICFGSCPERLQWEEEMTCSWDPHTMNLGRTSVMGLGGRGTLSQDSYQTAEGQVMRIWLPCKHMPSLHWVCPRRFVHISNISVGDVPLWAREPKRESGVTSGNICLLDSSSQTASVMLKREKRIGEVGEKRKSERTEAVSCERTNVMHLVMVPRKTVHRKHSAFALAFLLLYLLMLWSLFPFSICSFTNSLCPSLPRTSASCSSHFCHVNVVRLRTRAPPQTFQSLRPKQLNRGPW